MKTLHLVCAGALQAVAGALRAEFERAHDCTVAESFGAVGQQHERVLAGEPADVVVLTPALLDALAGSGLVAADSTVVLGEVGMGVCVPAGHARPDLSSPEAFREALLAASVIVYPDPRIASAGRNFETALARLGILDAVRARARNFPNGNASMVWLGDERIAGSIGVTQMSEIAPIPTVTLLGPVPAALQTLTVYAAARAARSARPALAGAYLSLLGSARGRQAIVAAGLVARD